MSTINYTLNWHPQFRVEDLGLDSLIFLGEQKQFLLPRTVYDSIQQVVSQHGQLSDFIFQSPDMLHNVRALAKIDQLVKDGIICNEEPSAYQTPDFSKSYGHFHYEGRKVYVLSQLIGDGSWVSILEGSTLPPQMALVLADDYLDPRLSVIQAELRAQNQPWLLCQLTGENPIIGPVFSQNGDAPCYGCLKSHLVRNRPVREWHRHQSGLESHAAVPVLNSLSTQKKAINLFKSNCLSGQAQNSLEGGVYVLDGERQEGSFYPVTKRNLCQGCGHEGQITQRPFTLQASILHEDKDGGLRSSSRKRTIDKLQSLINPVTGYLVDFKEVSSSDNEQMAIYQAAYFQNTFSKTQLSADSFVQLSLGKGVSKKQAKTSALGEAFERQAAQYTGEEAVTFSAASALDHKAFLPQELSPFSERQYQNFEAYNHASLQNPQWVRPMESEEEIHWVKGWSLTQKDYVFFPFGYCLANSPFEDRDYSVYTHNGNAAGNNKEEALLQGLLELIERDNTAIWWYNQIPRPEIDKEVISTENRQYIDNTLDADWNYWLLDISADLDVLTCVCVGAHKQTGRFVMGFGSHLDPQIACLRALTEMYQLIEIRDKVTGPFDFDAIPPHPFLFPAKRLPKKQLGDYKPVNRDIRESILYIQDELEKADLELCVVDYSRPDIPLNTLKVIVPGLCHFWPQYEAKRLYDIPVKMGWLSASLTEEELNPMPLYL